LGKDKIRGGKKGDSEEERLEREARQRLRKVSKRRHWGENNRKKRL